MDIEVHWVDPHDQSGQVSIGDSLRATTADIGPYDLATLSESWDGSIKQLWFEFYSGTHSTPTDVRIGWIKLTE